MTNTKKALLITPALLLICGGFFAWEYHKKTTHEYWGFEEARENASYVRKLKLELEPSGPGSLAEFKNLEHLTLSVWWKQMPGREYEQWENVRLPSGLKKLILERVDEQVVPALLKQVPGLEVLYLSCERWPRPARAPLPVFSLEKNSKLRRFYMFGCFYDRMPIGLTGLSRLERIYVSSSKINKLPHDFYRLENLKTLSIRTELPDGLPPNFYRLARLEELELDNAILKEPFSKLKRLPNLRKLKLNDIYGKGEAITLEPVPGDFPALEEIEIRYYKIKSLKGLEHLRNLRVLKLERLSLNPAKTVWSFPPGLRVLSLERLGLTKAPPAIGNLSELRVLNLSENCIDDLPAGFSNLKKLKRVKIADTGFNSFPDPLRKITGIEYSFSYDNYYEKNCRK